jgi:hypothetical protein
MNKKITLRRKRTLRKIGGALNCDKEGFNVHMREATMGRNYRNAIVDHTNSEQWPFEQLVDISTRGLVGWYCKQANLTVAECAIITGMPEVQILGAFFHRYKVFIEHIDKAKKALKQGLAGILFFPKKRDQFILRAVQSGKNDDIKLVNDLLTVEQYLPGGEKYEDFLTADLPIENAIERVQCLLWVIVKNKKLPDGFVMDKRIEARAKTPIILMKGRTNFGSNLASKMAQWSISQLAKLIEIVETDKLELGNLNLTFGVY